MIFHHTIKNKTIMKKNIPHKAHIFKITKFRCFNKKQINKIYKDKEISEYIKLKLSTKLTILLSMDNNHKILVINNMQNLLTKSLRLKIKIITG